MKSSIIIDSAKLAGWCAFVFLDIALVGILIKAIILFFQWLF